MKQKEDKENTKQMGKGGGGRGHKGDTCIIIKTSPIDSCGKKQSRINPEIKNI